MFFIVELFVYELFLTDISRQRNAIRLFTLLNKHQDPQPEDTDQQADHHNEATIKTRGANSGPDLTAAYQQETASPHSLAPFSTPPFWVGPFFSVMKSLYNPGNTCRKKVNFINKQNSNNKKKT